MTLTADLFFSFRSPYSYLSIGRYRRLTVEYDLEITLRPVFPLAIRDPDFFKRVDPRWVRYLRRDTARVGEYLGVPFTWPDPDPVVQDLETRTIAAEQPYIRPVTYLGVEAAHRGRGLHP